LKSHEKIAEQYAFWKFTSDGENLVLHALQIQKVGICHKFPGKQALI
jgi:hypothetical protein